MHYFLLGDPLRESQMKYFTAEMLSIMSTFCCRFIHMLVRLHFTLWTKLGLIFVWDLNKMSDLVKIKVRYNFFLNRD